MTATASSVLHILFFLIYTLTVAKGYGAYKIL